MPPVTAGVELTDVGATAATIGEEEDDVPLLLGSEPSHTRHARAAAHMHPPPNAPYTRDDRSWASKLVFSWINPVLDKVRLSAFPF